MNLDKIKEDIEKIKNRIKNKDLINDILTKLSQDKTISKIEKSSFHVDECIIFEFKDKTRLMIGFEKVKFIMTGEENVNNRKGFTYKEIIKKIKANDLITIGEMFLNKNEENIVYDYKNPEEDIKTLITYIGYLIREIETYRKNVHI